MQAHCSAACLSACFWGLAAAWAGATGGLSARLRSVQADFTQEKHLKILVQTAGLPTGPSPFRPRIPCVGNTAPPSIRFCCMHDGRIDKLIERDGRFEQDNGAGVDAMQVVLQDIGSWLDGRFTDNPLFTVTRAANAPWYSPPKSRGCRP